MLTLVSESVPQLSATPLPIRWGTHTVVIQMRWDASKIHISMPSRRNMEISHDLINRQAPENATTI